jgi:hypothetical protein
MQPADRFREIAAVGASEYDSLLGMIIAVGGD